MNNQEDLRQLIYDVERLKQAVGISDDDWKSPAKALKAMGIDRSVDWLRSILQRADYAHGARLDCSLVKGQHFTCIDNSWLVNVATIKPILLSGNMVLPEMPIDYVV